MPIRQITIIGTGLIGGSFGLALKKRGFQGRIVGCDRTPVLKRARDLGAIDDAHADPAAAVRGSQVVLLAVPVGAIIELIGRLGPSLPPKTLLTDVGSTKAEVLARAAVTFGKHAGRRFLAGHPMAGKEQPGVEAADPDLFQGAVWFVTPAPNQDVFEGLSGEFLGWVEKIGAGVASMNAEAHDQLCGWIAMPQFISTALAPAVDDMERTLHCSKPEARPARDDAHFWQPYSMWRDVLLPTRRTSERSEAGAASGPYPENLDTKELALEFERAHRRRTNYR
jgi:prephenate dehydrogenase